MAPLGALAGGAGGAAAAAGAGGRRSSGAPARPLARARARAHARAAARCAAAAAVEAAVEVGADADAARVLAGAVAAAQSPRAGERTAVAEWADGVRAAVGDEWSGDDFLGVGLAPGTGAGTLRLECTRREGACAGDVLLVVPERCLLFGVRQADDDDMDHECRVALALIDALGGGDGGSHASSVWRSYLRLLPSLGSLINPLSLSEEELVQLQEDCDDGNACGAAAAGRRSRAAVRACVPESIQRIARQADGGDPTAAGAVEETLEWALACVQSRAFDIEASSGMAPLEDGGFASRAGDHLALVPYLDSANHADGAVGERGLNADFQFERLHENGEGGMVLRAVADIAFGEEVCIRYHDGMPGHDVFATYGYWTVTPNDRLDLSLGAPLPLAAAAALHRAAESAATAATLEGDVDEASRCAAVGASARECTGTPRPALRQRATYAAESLRARILGNAANAKTLAALAGIRKKLQTQLDDMPSTIAEDEAEQTRLEERADERNCAVSARSARVVAYRAERKRLMHTALRAARAAEAAASAP